MTITIYLLMTITNTYVSMLTHSESKTRLLYQYALLHNYKTIIIILITNDYVFDNYLNRGSSDHVLRSITKLLLFDGNIRFW